jgi:hypothetical protein
MTMKNDWMSVRAGHVGVLTRIICVYAVLAVISIYMPFVLPCNVVICC